MPSAHADLPPHLLPAVVALIEAVSFAAGSGDRACLWLTPAELVGDGEAGRQTLLALFQAGLIDRRPLGAATGKRAKWVCRLKQSALHSIRLGLLLPQLDPIHRRAIPSAPILGSLYHGK